MPSDARYDKLYWDDIAGDMEYSPDDFHLTKTTVRRGGTSANVDLALQLDNRLGFCRRKPLVAHFPHRPRAQRRFTGDFRHPLSGERLPHRHDPRRRHARSPCLGFGFHVRRHSKPANFISTGSPRSSTRNQRNPPVPCRPAQGIGTRRRRHSVSSAAERCRVRSERNGRLPGKYPRNSDFLASDRRDARLHSQGQRSVASACPAKPPYGR